MGIFRIAVAWANKLKDIVQKRDKTNREKDEEIQLRGVEILPESECSNMVTAVLSGEPEQIIETKMLLYAILSALRGPGIDVKVVDSGNMFAMYFDNECAAEFARGYIISRIVK
ncbi:MAG: hypothetical protein K6D97_08250 [Clostridia bacterium]|nr:hypothetical protein [Clostridia bacterium]